MYTVGSPRMTLLRLAMLRRAGIFAQPEGDGGDGGDGGKGGDGAQGGKGGKEGEGGDKGKQQQQKQQRGPVAYDRFARVNTAKRDAEQKLATATADVERLTRENEQLKSSDKAGELVKAQARITELEKAIQQTDADFEELLESSLEGLPDEVADMVRDIPGGPKAQFAYFTKHRARLAGNGAAGGEGEEGGEKGEKGVKGPKNERKPDGGKKSEPSSVAKTYVSATKPKKEGGFAGLA